VRAASRAERLHRSRLEAQRAQLQLAIHQINGIVDHEDPIMTAPAESLEVDHSRLGVDLFNHVWTLIETADRTAAQTDEMIHAAHASRYHWWRADAGPEHLARGEWQCSRVYAVLGRGEPALWHARRCLEMCEANGIGDWDLAFAYEALARLARRGRPRSGGAVRDACQRGGGEDRGS
jgi:hypothetical protein